MIKKRSHRGRIMRYLTRQLVWSLHKTHRLRSVFVEGGGGVVRDCSRFLKSKINQIKLIKLICKTLLEIRWGDEIHCAG